MAHRSTSSAQRLLAISLLASALMAPPASAQPVGDGGTPPPGATGPATFAPVLLTELLARVVPQDPQVRSTQALALAAQERVRQARSRWWPVLGVDARRGKSKAESFGMPVDRTTDRAAANLRWNLYNAGADAAEVAAAESEATAAQEDYRRAAEEVAERLAQAHAELFRNQERKRIAQLRLETLRKIQAQVQQQFDAGKIAEADLVQAAAGLIDAELDLEQVLSEWHATRARLAALAGGPIDSVQGIPQALLEVDLAPPGGAGDVPQPGVLEAARLRAQAARERVPSAWSVYAPRVDLEYERQLRDRTRPALTEQQRYGWVVTARWELPLGGEKQARRREARHRAEAADAETERIMLTLRAELANLPDRIRTSAAAALRLGEQLSRYDTLLRASTLQIEAGRRSLSQLVQLHEGRYRVQERLLQERFQWQSASLRMLALHGDLLPRLGLNASAP